LEKAGFKWIKEWAVGNGLEKLKFLMKNSHWLVMDPF